jgi:energy-coupling factor transport system permease protein
MATTSGSSLDFLANARGDTWFHRLDPRTKILYLVALVGVDLIFLKPLYLFTVFLSTVPIWISSKVKLRPILPQLTGFSITLLSFMLFAFSFSGAVGTSGHVDADETGIPLGPFVIYPSAASIGAVQVLRMAIPMATSLLVFATTDPTAFARALNQMKVPREISFMMVTALRLFPLVLEESTNINQAQKVRGVSTKGLANRIRATGILVLPLFINILRQSRDLGIAVESRGFGARQWHGSLRELSFGTNDYLMFVWIVIFVSIGLYVRFVLGLGWAWII